MKAKRRATTLAGIGTVIAVMLAAVAVLVYVSGTNSVAVHFFYIPIILAGYAFGDVGAVIVALAAAALCGPWAPSEVTAAGAVEQPSQDVILRALIFFVIGVAASRIFAELKRRLREIDTLYDVARSITSSLRIRQVLSAITEHAVGVTNAKACAIRLLNRDSSELELAAQFGLSDEYKDKGPVSLDGSELDRQVLAGEVIEIANVARDPRFQYPQEAAREGIASVLSVPLMSKDDARGVIRIYSSRPHRFRLREIELVQAFARQAAIAIENAELYEDIRRNYFETVRALTIAMEAKDSATYSHSERVTELAVQLAQKLGITDDDLELLRFGAMLHDIGKIGVAESALEDTDRISEGQIFYRMHPLIGRSILQPITFLAPVLPVVVSHHEYWDGSGFPQGLKGEDIPRLARIVAVVDRYERLVNPGFTSDHDAMTPREALDTIMGESGHRFDPQIVSVFSWMQTHADKPVKKTAEEDAAAAVVPGSDGSEDGKPAE